ncbi:MAG TPA: transcription-repair coupling factor [Chloroflexi bacterium]|nr:transcription-repair coupling factor [Chloroflexota bacterium]
MINLSPLLRLFKQIEPLKNLSDSLAMGQAVTRPLETPVAARPALLSAIHQSLQAPVLFITARADRARTFSDQLRFWAADPQRVLRLPDPGVLPYERIPWSEDIIARRLGALTHLSINNTPESAPLIVSAARALMQKTMPPVWLQESLQTYRVGQQISMTQTLAIWVSLGYRHRGVVEEPGEFSHRGGIMDIFPPGSPHPIRIDLFGDEIDSLRAFDPITQRSETRLKTLTIGPATEALPAHSPRAARRLRSLDASALQPMADHDLRETLLALDNGSAFRGIENYLPLMSDNLACILDYLPANGLIVLENPAELENIIHDLNEQANTLKDDLVKQHTLPPDWPQPHFDWDFLAKELRQRAPLILGFDDWQQNTDERRKACPELAEGTKDESEQEKNSSFVLRPSSSGDGSASTEADPQPVYSLQSVFAAPKVFGGRVKEAVSSIRQRKEAGERVVIASRQAVRLSDLLAAQNVTAAPVQSLNTPPPGSSVTLFKGPLLEGWLLRPREGASPLLTLLTDAELFGMRKALPRRRPRKPRGITPETFFSDVNPGDYVVHIEHGIGVFKGLVKLEIDGVAREYLEVHYKKGDKLYVPIHQADRLSKYVGPDSADPTLNRLGTLDWTRIKKRAKKAIADIADELLRIYAAREVVPGRAFIPDTEWQREMEASFAYVETEDQLHALEDVKKDMEQPKPMDRLICGDVGYGKTEVALRAAFKAVMSGAQAAILVPTTVLAQQHFNTFRQRLASFPVTVEMLSRFRTKKESNQVLSGLAAGGVDIVIGTHRLLQKDVAFKDLGLLIIDEEQRFGVGHKERLKQLRANVDTLTLTATPIPRTLHMALANVRAMSVIETPPEERLPIKTTITKDDDTLIRTVIQREMDRGGQVYFVHNRVMGIEQMAQRVRKLVPEARVTVGHGQMSERKLEKVMLQFSAGDFDVLVSTTIIESGLDIPNVNTIIINRADRFGLAQLYQLRGRVGRAAIQSYAYLLVPKHHQLSDVAQQRLDAIREAAELGAGFKIAMRDLEIRGAGDILGAKQHGHIAAVGFDLYVRLLTQAVQQLKSQDGQEQMDELAAAYLSPLEEDIQINLPLPVYLPENYVTEEHLRLKLYRRMGNLSSLEEVDTMGQELEDRFGSLPETVANLLYQLKLKVLSRAAGVKYLNVEGEQIVIRADTLEEIDRDVLQRRLEIGAKVGRRQIWLPLYKDPAIWQNELQTTLQFLGQMIHDPGG